LLAGLSQELIEEIGKLALLRRFHTGQQIITGGDSSDSIFFLQSGMVSVKRADGLRLATLVPGMAFGEMALVEAHRTADVWADTAVQCMELPLERFYGFRELHPQVGERIMRNLAGLLSHRLGRANKRITTLASR
jgi:glutaminase